MYCFKLTQKTSRIIWKIYFPECSGDPSANEWKWLWNVHMQIRWIHHQRPTNHIHTGEYNLHRVLNMLLVTLVYGHLIGFSFFLFLNRKTCPISENEWYGRSWNRNSCDWTLFVCVCTEHYFDLSYGYEGSCALQEPRDKYGMPSITAHFCAV